MKSKCANVRLNHILNAINFCTLHQIDVIYNISKKLSFQAFTDMQVNKIETTKKLKMLELQADMLKTSKKKYDITDKEVSNLATDTRCVSLNQIIFI